jgi:hypothetical protein
MNDQAPDVNPYRADPLQSVHVPGVVPEGGRSVGSVGRVLRVAVLLIVHGVMLLMGGAFAGLAVFGFSTMGPEGFGGDATTYAMMKWSYLGISILLTIVGLLQLTAGIRNYYFRSKGLGLVALGAGLLSMFTFFCLPTSLALAIYGIIVYVDPESNVPFALRKSGLTREEVLARLGRPHMPT